MGRGGAHGWVGGGVVVGRRGVEVHSRRGFSGQGVVVAIEQGPNQSSAGL